MEQFPRALHLRGPTCLCPCPPHPTSHVFVRIRKPGRGILGSQSKDAVSAGEQHFSLWYVALTQWYLGRWGGSDPERSETENSRSERTTWQQHGRSGRREQPESWDPEQTTGKGWCLWGITKAGLRGFRNSPWSVCQFVPATKSLMETTGSTILCQFGHKVHLSR